MNTLVDNMRDSAFHDITILCSVGQLKVYGLTLVLLIPAPYRSLYLWEGGLLLMPQHNVKDFEAMMEPQGAEKVKGVGVAGSRCVSAEGVKMFD